MAKQAACLQALPKREQARCLREGLKTHRRGRLRPRQAPALRFAGGPIMERDSMHAYYCDRAPYMARNVEDDPREFVRDIIAELKSLTNGQSVLEVACGTGNWTRLVAPCARTIVATDYSEGMLDVARSRQIPKTRFVHDDAYSLGKIGSERFNVGYALWLVSHLSRARWDEFFTAFHARLNPGAKVLLVDDIRRPDDTDPWYSKVDTRDSYEIRRLPNGKSYEIVKTYFTPEQLHSLLQPYADNLQIRYERPCWWAAYEVRSNQRI